MADNLNPITQDGDYRRYLAETLEKRRKAFLRNYQSVIADPSPVPVHDLRVSIRRLSAILSLLDNLTGKTDFRVIEGDLKKMMAPLGELRDVQTRVEWINKFEPEPAPMISKAIGALKDRETFLIKGLAASLSGIPSDHVSGLKADEYFKALDAYVNEKKLDVGELCGLEVSYLLDRYCKRAENYRKTLSSDALHKARIAFKKFRYTIEVFLPLHPDFDSKKLNESQTRLGDIHDLDLLVNWLGTLRFAVTISQNTELRRLGRKAKAERGRLVKELKNGHKSDVGLFNRWRAQMRKGKDKKRIESLKEAKAEVVSLCTRFDPDPPHASHVGILAVKMFDELVKLGLHDLGERHRILLEYGCFLHDIGWVDGQQRHHKRSFEMILCSELPLDKKDLIVVALIARFHRKGDPGKQEEFKKLSPKERKAVSKLAAIIRVADVLDRTHNQKVKIREIALAENAVSLLVSSGGLKDIPETALQKKTAYFAEAFGTPITISEK